MKKKKPLPSSKYPKGTKQLIYFRLFICSLVLAIIASVAYGLYDKIREL